MLFISLYKMNKFGKNIKKNIHLKKSLLYSYTLCLLTSYTILVQVLLSREPNLFSFPSIV